MQTINRQSGLTMISWALVLGIGAFFVMLALRLTPVYLENFKVSSHLKTLQKDPNTATMSEDEIVRTLFKRLDIDDVENVKADDVLITVEGSIMKINITYEVRKPTIGNIDIVAHFEEEVEVSR